jgi:hypothetical protein
MIQPLPPDQAAYADRSLVRLAERQVQPEAVAVVAVDRPFQDVLAGLVEVPDPLVPDEAEKGGLVQQLEDERRIVDRQPAEDQPVRFDDDQRTSTVSSITRPVPGRSNRVVAGPANAGAESMRMGDDSSAGFNSTSSSSSISVATLKLFCR